MVILPLAMTAEVRHTQRWLLLISSVHNSSAGVVGRGVVGLVLAPGAPLPPRSFSPPSSRPYCAYATPPATSSPASASPATSSRRRAGRTPAGIPPAADGGAGVWVSTGRVAPPASVASTGGTLAIDFAGGKTGRGSSSGGS